MYMINCYLLYLDLKSKLIVQSVERAIADNATLHRCTVCDISVPTQHDVCRYE